MNIERSFSTESFYIAESKIEDNRSFSSVKLRLIDRYLIDSGLTNEWMPVTGLAWLTQLL